MPEGVLVRSWASVRCVLAEPVTLALSPCPDPGYSDQFLIPIFTHLQGLANYPA